MKPKHSKALSRAFACTILIASIALWGFGLFPRAGSVSAQPPSQNDGLQMTVTPAFTGYFKYGEWLPIWVELENNGGDVHYETDFRSVYARVIDQWLGADSVILLNGDFKKRSLSFL